jgi:glycosyltransferase 2 family protein
MSSSGAQQRSVNRHGLLGGRGGFYAAPRDQPRVRRATDIVGLVASLLALAGVVAAQPPGPLERSLLRFLQAFPPWLGPVWGSLIGLLIAWVAVLLAVPLVSGRPRVVLEALLAVALAGLLGLVVARVATGAWPGGHAVTGLSPRLHFPGIRLAMAAAVICVVNANLTRPLAAKGRRVLALGAAGALLDGSTTVGGTAAAVLAGVAAGAAVRLALGTSRGLPTIASVAGGLEDLGVEALDLEVAERQTAGVLRVHGRQPNGGSLTIKVYGRDAYDNQMLEKLWRAIWYREGGSSAGGPNRSRGAEREALLTLLARNAGAPTAEVVAVGATARGDSLLVLRVSGTPLESLPAGDLDDAVLRESWSTMERLGGANLAHGHISPAALRVDGAARQVSIVELGGGKVAPSSDERQSDRAQLLATTAAVAGTDRAVAAASAGIGREGLAAVLPYVQQAAFGLPLRRALKAAEIDVDKLREAVAAATGEQGPELAKLRRVTWQTIVQVGLFVLAGGAVLSFVGGVDFDEFKHALDRASWGWIVAGVVVAQLPRLTQAIATRGSIPADLPFGPIYLLQLATSYLNLAVPTSLGGLAIAVRFFQRQGVPAAAAVTSSTINTLANNVVQALLLIALVAFSGATLNLQIGAPGASGATHILFLLLGIVAAVALCVVVLGHVGKARAAVREHFSRWWPQVHSTFAALRASNKLSQLLLGNVATEVLFATALGLFVRGLGYPLSIADLIVINTGTSLFSSLIPVPGGIGVVEGGLVVGLSSSGLEQSAAFAAVLLYRISTFYLPPIWGWFALNWLRRNRYL